MVFFLSYKTGLWSFFSSPLCRFFSTNTFEVCLKCKTVQNNSVFTEGEVFTQEGEDDSYINMSYCLQERKNFRCIHRTFASYFYVDTDLILLRKKDSVNCKPMFGSLAKFRQEYKSKNEHFKKMVMTIKNQYGFTKKTTIPNKLIYFYIQKRV